jgi:hypothetical protein
MIQKIDTFVVDETFNPFLKDLTKLLSFMDFLAIIFHIFIFYSRGKVKGHIPEPLINVRNKLL